MALTRAASATKTLNGHFRIGGAFGRGLLMNAVLLLLQQYSFDDPAPAVRQKRLNANASP
jgi:hypothetical protein